MNDILWALLAGDGRAKDGYPAAKKAPEADGNGIHECFLFFHYGCAPAARSPRIFSTHLQQIQLFAESRAAPSVAINSRRRTKKRPLGSEPSDRTPKARRTM